MLLKLLLVVFTYRYKKRSFNPFRIRRHLNDHNILVLCIEIGFAPIGIHRVIVLSYGIETI